MKHLATIALALALALYVYSGTFMRLEADDYCMVANTERLGVTGLAIEEYTTWSGRFAYFLTVGTLVDVFGFSAPAVIPGLLIVGLMLSLWWAFKPHTSHALLLALGITFAFVEGQLSLWQNLYWMASSVTYITPLIVGVWFAGWLSRYWRSSRVSLLPDSTSSLG